MKWDKEKEVLEELIKSGKSYEEIGKIYNCSGANIKKSANIRNYLINVTYITIGCIIMGIGTSLFLLPNKLSTGGVSGIATIGYYLLNVPLGTTILVLNIPLFIIAFFKVGKELFINSIIGTILLSQAINLFERIEPLTQDRPLACIYGGILVGVGMAIVLKGNGSTGGTDLLTYIIRRYRPHFKSSSLIVIIDVIIVILNVFFFKEIEIGLYSAIAIYIMGKMIDIVFEGINFTKMIFIVSNKYKEIANKIGEKYGRGSTAIYAKGMYTREKKMMLLCVVSRNEVAKIKEISLNIDPKSFIIIANARETWGKGFKMSQ